MQYDKLILNSHNSIKTTWNIINTESGWNRNRNDTQAVNVEGKKILINNLLLKLSMTILWLLLRNYQVAAQLVASQVVLSSTELVSLLEMVMQTRILLHLSK
jgi:hypothetical protein